MEIRKKLDNKSQKINSGKENIYDHLPRPTKLLMKRSEIISKNKHRNKFLLGCLKIENEYLKWRNA